MSTRIFTCLILVLVSLFSLGTVSAQEKPAIPGGLVVINQVRGEECCAKGSISHLTTQLETVTRLQIPATFVVRYDAILRPEYVELLAQYRSQYADLIDLGVMVEITPQLAADAGVTYTGTDETWYQAHHAFTIGYTKEDRKKIVDHLMTTFTRVFGVTPTVSSAWMIDTESANYLHDTYGIQYQQITREQWGTDSYTLYGGPPHYPYPAARSWLLTPDYTEKSPVWIIRQTITDPIYNYGDTTSTFTTQPNDYMRAGRDQGYFEGLVTNALTGQLPGQPGFGCLGLENNMEDVYQQAFVKQLEYISRQKYPVIKPTDIPTIYRNQSTIYQGALTDKKALWVTTPSYRLRIIQDKASTMLTDLRIYSPKITDPYNDTIAKHEGYWVQPFLIDGSRWYYHPSIDPRVYEHVFVPPMNDFFTTPTALTLPKPPVDNYPTRISSVQMRPEYVAYQYYTSDKQEMMMIFGPTDIQMIGFNEHERKLPYIANVPSAFPVSENKIYLTWNYGDETPYRMEFDCQPKQCNLVFDTANIDIFSRVRADQYPYLFPESIDRKLDSKRSRVTASNTYAIAGRNPVRLTLEPLDAYNFPILLDEEARIELTPTEGVTLSRLGYLRQSTHQYVDIYASSAATVKATILMKSHGQEAEKSVVVYFAPNCARSPLSCLNPVSAWRYMVTKVSDWWNGRK